MRGSLRNNSWSRYVLSLILLATNIGAPFRTSTLGRVFLQNSGWNAATSTVVRVRVVPPVGSSQGFRVVVGLSGNDPDRADSAANARAFSDVLLSLTDAFPSRHGDRPVVRPHPFLRC